MPFATAHVAICVRELNPSFASMFAASPLLKAQIDPHSLIGHKRIPRLEELVDAFDFEAICYRNMTLEPYDYMAHGDGSEWNLRRNRQVFDWVDIVQVPLATPAAAGPGAPSASSFAP